MNARTRVSIVTALALLAGTCAGLRAAPKIEFEKEILELGSIKAGSSINAVYSFKNTGDTELEIINVRPGCGCTKAEALKKKLPPGEASTIEAVFNSTGFNGPISKAITVTTNDPARPSLFLQIRGTVSMAAILKPATISFDNIRVNGAKTFTLTVTPEDPKTFAITEVVPVGGHLTVPGFRKVELKNGAFWEVYLVLKAGKSPTRVMDTVRIVTNTANREVLTATVYGNVVQ